ncbi:VirB3 family type IV secretion system protein [Burkholderia sp. BCC1993]|uniref:VirB3 family type IV secretion system protein n=1 Tax=Burkholderia sp. BCC1993 TaxID=2817444 RepID=UPI002AB173DA|nr:VirB3 family type IV secretion system protein [Burkholderia sp. BCC1993]
MSDLQNDEIPGYEVPLHQSTISPILKGGIPEKLAIVIGTIGAAISFGLQEPLYGIPFTLVVLYAAKRAAKSDPWVFDVLRRLFKQKRYYDV